jgi:hypothetical protein
MKFENCDPAESIVKCAVCSEAADVMTDCIGLTHLPQFKDTAGGWLPVCNLCDKINDQFYDLKLVPFNIESDYK